MDFIVRTENLTKQYGNQTVVNNLNMRIKKGEVYGFLGQNGAGKTTTLAMIMDLITPTRGSVELFGKEVGKFKRQMFARVGSLIEFPAFYPKLTARENLEIHKRMMGVQEHNCIEENLSALGIMDAADVRVGEFSLGMKQRLGIARAMLHCPEILILDEPTNGLDPIGIREIRELILYLRDRKEITFLVSSHILSEIQQVANRIGVIHQGILLEEIEYDELQKRNRHYLQIKVDDDKRASLLLEQKFNIGDYVIWEKGILRLYEHLNEAAEINKILIQNEIAVSELTLNIDSLEDYFIRLTGEVGNVKSDLL